MGTIKTNKKEEPAPSPNLGLDADGSSADTGKLTRLNNDNDRISGNVDGESDDSDHGEMALTSPLDEK